MKKLNQNDNILIGYTKWLLKWLLIIVVILGIAFGGYIYYDQEYKDAEVTMLYLSCTSEKLPHVNEQDYVQGTYIYKVTKKRNKSAPYAIYVASQRNDKVEDLHLLLGRGQIDTSPYQDYIENKMHIEYDEQFWMFENTNFPNIINDKNTTMDYFGRKSLVRFRFSSNEPLPVRKWNCETTSKTAYKEYILEKRKHLKEYKF